MAGKHPEKPIFCEANLRGGRRNWRLCWSCREALYVSPSQLFVTLGSTIGGTTKFARQKLAFDEVNRPRLGNFAPIPHTGTPDGRRLILKTTAPMVLRISAAANVADGRQELADFLPIFAEAVAFAVLGLAAARAAVLTAMAAPTASAPPPQSTIQLTSRPRARGPKKRSLLA